jgi:hypothetical protein
MSVPNEIEEYVAAHPLMRFSIYTNSQAYFLLSESEKLLDQLESAFGESTACGLTIQAAYGTFWLWTLGAYEVVRTMDRHKRCFSPRLTGLITRCLTTLTLLRIPFAKQQLPGKKIPIAAEASMSGIDSANKDISYTIAERKITMRETIAEFRDLIQSITPDDVLADLRDSYRI